MATRAYHTEQLVISCEHASNRLPPRYGSLGLAPRWLGSHIAWDPGAREVARYCARRLGCAYHEGKYARVLIDLNRSPHNRKLIPKASFGVTVPGNADLPPAERRIRMERYYEPYRTALHENIDRTIARYGTCLHFSVHSFASRMKGIRRRADLGVLYDPGRSPEASVAAQLVEAFRQAGFLVRRNYPYRGTGDGVTTATRKLFRPAAYLGLELELNERLLERPADLRETRTRVAAAIERLVS